jgi:hypothetical protein
MLPTKFQFIWPKGYRREEFLKSANQKQMYRNLVGSIYGKSSVAIAYVVLIR